MRRRNVLLSLAGAAGAGLAGVATAELRDRRRVAADPERALFFEHPAGGEERTVLAPDGTRLHVELWGPQDAPPVVLVHGWTCALHFWRRQIRDLMADHRVIAFDLRGHGRSGAPEGRDWSPDALADDLEAVLEACVPDRPALLGGHSLGAMTIVAWAGRYPEAVRERATAAVLCNTGLGDLVTESLLLRPPDAFGRVHQTLGGLLLAAPAPLPSRPDPITHRAVRYVALSPSASPAAVRFSEELVLGCHPRVRGAYGRELTRLDLRERAEHLTVPTVVVAGTADRLTPPVHARRLAEALPDCRRLLEHEGSGHMGPLERAGEVSAVLRELAGERPAEAAEAAAAL
jgi:pimeloyl-ACP methyl ester carboxylesterase